MKKLMIFGIVLALLSSIFTVAAFAVKEEPALVYGDVNGDGKCNSTDYSLVKRFILKSIEVLPYQDGIVAADVNADGKVNSLDYSYIKRKILGLIEKFPAEDKVVIPGEIDQDVIQANSKFAFDIFKQLNIEDKGESVLISPLSISTLLSMVYQGAENNTKEQMRSTLGYEGINDENINESYKSLLGYLNQVDEKVKSNINNSIWLNENMQGEYIIQQDFISVNEDMFNADIEKANFSEQSEVDRLNNWISESTNGLIKGMIKKEDVEKAIMTLVNAIYFKGDWAEKFDVEGSAKKKFYNEDGTSCDVMMMKKTGGILYREGNDYKAVKLPYGDKKTAMYCILPKEGTINEFISEMDSMKWEDIRKNIYNNKVILELPRFKMEYGVKSLTESLKKLGMTDVFNADSADLSGMCERDVYVSEVLHKAVIEVNEEGSEATAATVASVVPSVGMGSPEPYKEFKANRPFVFIIADDEYGTIMFMGKVSEVEEIN